jgi:acyl-CoA thioester hydrolase
VTLELGQVTSRKPPFKYSVLMRVGFSDTDAQGVVYYGRYMPYFDRARVEYHRHLGQAPTGGTGGFDLVMRALSVEYLAPARFDDLIEVFVRIARIGTTSATYEHEVYRVGDDLLLVAARQSAVLIDPADRRLVPVPDDYRQQIRAFEGAGVELAVST